MGRLYDKIRDFFPLHYDVEYLDKEGNSHMMKLSPLMTLLSKFNIIGVYGYKYNGIIKK